MSGIFISYRRDDATADAGRLFDDLQRRCPDVRVFMDLQIPAGTEFREVTIDSLDSCEVVLVLIGPNWMSQRDPKSGLARLNDENDFVRFEIVTALQKRKVVIPILLRGAPLPPESDLPANIKGLVKRQAIDIRANRWRVDVDALVSQLPQTLKCRGHPDRRVTWLYLLLLPVLLIAASVQFLAVNIPVRPQLVAFGLAGSIGVLHTWLFRLPASSRILLSAFISVATVILMSALSWLIYEDPFLPNTPIEVRWIGMFVMAILAGYLAGGICVDAFRWRAKTSE